MFVAEHTIRQGYLTLVFKIYLRLYSALSTLLAPDYLDQVETSESTNQPHGGKGELENRSGWFIFRTRVGDFSNKIPTWFSNAKEIFFSLTFRVGFGEMLGGGVIMMWC